MRKRRRGREGRRTLRGLLVLWAFFAVAIPVSVDGVAGRVGERVVVPALGVGGGHLGLRGVCGGMGKKERRCGGVRERVERLETGELWTL